MIGRSLILHLTSLITFILDWHKNVNKRLILTKNFKLSLLCRLVKENGEFDEEKIIEIAKKIKKIYEVEDD